MSGTESADDWTALIAKEAQVLRSGQSWADIFDDEDGTDQANDANTTGEAISEKPIDYLDDIDIAITQPRISTSTPVSSVHRSSDSDNWRVRETEVDADSDNWRVRDPSRKPTSFTSFNDDRFEKDRFEKDRSEIIRQRQEERKEYRVPEKRTISPEDAAAVQQWNSFHLVVAQEELEKEKEKERLKKRYLESQSELVKGDTNQEIGINESQKIHQNEDKLKLNPESDEKTNSSNEKPVSSKEEKNQPLDNTLNLIKEGSSDKDEEKLNVVKEEKKQSLERDNIALPHKEITASVEEESVNKNNNAAETLQTSEKILDTEKSLTIENEKVADIVKKEGDSQIKQKSAATYEEEKNQDSNTLTNSDSKEGDDDNRVSNDVPSTESKEKEEKVEEEKKKEEKVEMIIPTKNDLKQDNDLVDGKEISEAEKEEVKDNISITKDVNTQENGSNDEKEEVVSTEEDQLEKNDSAYDETESVPLKEEEEEEEEEERDLNMSSKEQEPVEKEHLENDDEEPVVCTKEDKETEELSKSEKVESNSVSTDSKAEYKEKEISSTEPDQEEIQSKNADEKAEKKEENKDVENGLELEKSDEVCDSKALSEAKLDGSADHQALEPKNSECVLENGDSLEEIKKEYVDLEKQSAQEYVAVDFKENEALEIMNEEKENSQIENNQLIDENAKNDSESSEDSNSVAVVQPPKTCNLDETKVEKPVEKSHQTESTGWGEEPAKVEEESSGITTSWNQASTKDIQKEDNPEDQGQKLTSEGGGQWNEVQDWNSQPSQVKVEPQQGNNTGWNQEVSTENKFDDSNGWGQESTKQWNEGSWNQNQDSNTNVSESSQGWGAVDQLKSPNVAAAAAATKKPVTGSWRDQIASAPKDDNVGGWKQFASSEAAQNVVRETRIESPKPKKSPLPPKSIQSPKLENSLVSNPPSWTAPIAESWSNKADTTQTTTPVSAQSNAQHQVDFSSSWSKNQETSASSPNITHTNPSWSTSLPKHSDTASVTSSSSNTATNSNPWAQFSASEMQRSARSRAENKQSHVGTTTQLQQTQQVTQTASKEPPVVNISLSDFDSIQFENKNTPHAPVEINMSLNNDDFIIHPSRTVHLPLVVALDDEPQEIIVTPKLQHASLPSTHHQTKPNIQLDGSQWKLPNGLLDK